MRAGTCAAVCFCAVVSLSIGGCGCTPMTENRGPRPYSVGGGADLGDYWSIIYYVPRDLSEEESPLSFVEEMSQVPPADRISKDFYVVIYELDMPDYRSSWKAAYTFDNKLIGIDESSSAVKQARKVVDFIYFDDNGVAKFKLPVKE